MIYDLFIDNNCSPGIFFCKSLQFKLLKAEKSFCLHGNPTKIKIWNNNKTNNKINLDRIMKLPQKAFIMKNLMFCKTDANSSLDAGWPLLR